MNVVLIQAAFSQSNGTFPQLPPKPLATSFREKAAMLAGPAAVVAAVILGWMIYSTQSRFHAPSDTIDFSKSTNLKAIYDAGIRPWRSFPDSSSSVRVTHLEKIGIILPGSKPFEMSVQIGSFDVLADNQLARAELIGEPTSLASAAAQTRRICETLGLATGGLDEAVAASAHRGWAANLKRGEMRVQVLLQSISGFFGTDGNVCVTIQFVKPGAPMKFLKAPIQPPPGYEGVSMDPPERSTKRVTPLPPKVKAILDGTDR